MKYFYDISTNLFLFYSLSNKWNHIYIMLKILNFYRSNSQVLIKYYKFIKKIIYTYIYIYDKT